VIGEPDAGKPHVRFDEGVQETCDIAARLRPTLPCPHGRLSACAPELTPHRFSVGVFPIFTVSTGEQQQVGGVVDGDS
jgi:hypothetical protein